MSEQAVVNPALSYAAANGRAAPPVSNAEETNPLAAIAGSYAADPFWDEFVQLLEESRQALDAEPVSAEYPGVRS